MQTVDGSVLKKCYHDNARYRSVAGAGIIGPRIYDGAKIGSASLQRLDCEATAARRLELCPAGAVVGCTKCDWNKAHERAQERDDTAGMRVHAVPREQVRPA